MKVQSTTKTLIHITLVCGCGAEVKAKAVANSNGLGMGNPILYFGADDEYAPAGWKNICKRPAPQMRKPEHWVCGACARMWEQLEKLEKP